MKGMKSVRFMWEDGVLSTPETWRRTREFCPGCGKQNVWRGWDGICACCTECGLWQHDGQRRPASGKVELVILRQVRGEAVTFPKPPKAEKRGPLALLQR